MCVYGRRQASWRALFSPHPPTLAAVTSLSRCLRLLAQLTPAGHDLAGDSQVVAVAFGAHQRVQDTCNVSCAAGHSGVPVASCSTDGGEFQFSGG